MRGAPAGRLYWANTMVGSPARPCLDGRAPSSGCPCAIRWDATRPRQYATRRQWGPKASPKTSPKAVVDSYGKDLHRGGS